MARIHRTTVGNAELIALQDSWMQMPPTGFFSATKPDDWTPYRDFLDANGNLTLNLGAWLIRSGGRTVLVDTGLGAHPMPMPLQTPPALPALLVEADVRPVDVDIVIFTHLHGDHTGWNTLDTDQGPRPMFPHARHIIQHKEWEYWKSQPPLREAAKYDLVLAPLQQAGLLDLVEGEYAVTPDVTTVPTPGHTPGHVSFVIASGGQRAYIAGDAIHQPVQVTMPDWGPGADTDPVQSAQSRHALLDRVEREGALLAGGHFPFPSMGRAVRVGGRRVFRGIDA